MSNRTSSRAHGPSLSSSSRTVTADASSEAKIGARVQVQPNGCWAYNGVLDKYHAVMPTGRGSRVPAHRYFYETLVGPVLDGMHLHHECQNPGCVNPGHLTSLTPGDHVREHARLNRLSQP